MTTDKVKRIGGLSDPGYRTVSLYTIADYLMELSNHISAEDSENLPQFLRVLAERVAKGEIV